MIFLSVSAFATIAIVPCMILGTLSFPEFKSTEEFIVCIVLPVLYMLCFTLLGVSGLYAFRKKKKNLAGTPATEPEV
jgi:hypothetical protein